jgi:hypothetical protein
MTILRIIMHTIILIIKLLIKLLLFIAILPVLVLFVVFRLRLYRMILVKNMMEAGMPKEYAKQLAR